MTLLKKENALFVKCCIIQNGVTDSEGDTLTTKEIKQIFTSFNNQSNFEIYHNGIPISEVHLLENYISNSEEAIGNITIPAGSWNGVIRVDDPDIQKSLLNGEFGGVSLSNRVKPQCSKNLHGEINYRDLKSAECVIPMFISFVKEGANGVPLHVMDYDVYIKKSKKNGANRMSLLEKLKALVAEAETETEAPTIVKEAKNDEEEAVVEEPKDEEEAEAQEEDKAEEVTIDKEAETEEATEKEATEEEVKNDDTPQEEDFKAEIEALKAEIEKINETLAKLQEDDAESEEESDKEEEKPVITKSAKITVTNEESTTTHNFYEMTNRDPVTGKRIRSQSKILN